MESSTCSMGGSCVTDSLTGGAVSTICSSDYKTDVEDLYGTSPFLLMTAFTDSNCSSFGYGSAYFATGNCEGSPRYQEYKIVSLEDDGSASIRVYDAAICLDASLNTSYTIDKGFLSNHSCDSLQRIWYSSNNVATSAPTPTPTPTTTRTPTTPTPISPAGMGTGAAVGIGIGAVALLLVVVLLFWCYRKRFSKKAPEDQFLPTSIGSVQTVPSQVLYGQSPELWKDDIIVAKRISRSKVHINTTISQGAYGVVYSGTYNGQQVAVKMLLPATRTSLQSVNEFLAEAKMTAAMDHPNIVSFVGVAWNSLSDVCVVLEFMDRGDLRSLLDNFLATHHQVGFTRQKVTIALQVCHALTYLHSLVPPVVHRDLKSRNILLNHEMEAKLTDFGISKERLDRTLTAGVGTSLWMAPEVMLGEWYDDKADMFSFGVVLSELDVHTLPYSNIKQNHCDPHGRQVTDTMLLQQVASGKVRVEFSGAGSPSMAQLGYACVSTEPSQRPSAAEALYMLQTIRAQEL